MNTQTFENHVAFTGTNITEDEVAQMGLTGTLYPAGSIAADHDTETLHHIRCLVLRSWGIDADADYILVTDADMAAKIDAEIEQKSDLVFQNSGYIASDGQRYNLYFSFDQSVLDSFGQKIVFPAALKLQEKVMNTFSCNGALIGKPYYDDTPDAGIYFELEGA